MPHYDYVCSACGHALEVFQSITEPPKKKCPQCGRAKLVRQIGSGAAILFKGSGYYQTDYRSESYKEGAKRSAEGKKETTASDAPAPASTSASEPAKSAEAKPSTESTNTKPTPKATKKKKS